MSPKDNPNTRRWRGYSTFELALSSYIIFAVIVATGLIILNQRKITKAFTPNYATTTVQGSSATKNKPKSDPAPTAYVEQTVSGHDFKVSLMFDPNGYGIIRYNAAIDSDPNSANDELDIIGNPIGSTNKLMISVTKAPLDNTCIINPKPPRNQTSIYTKAFDTSIMGKSYTVYKDGTSRVLVNVPNGQSCMVIFIDNYSPAGSINPNRNEPIDASVEQTILRSIVITQ